VAATDQIMRRLAATVASNSYRAHPETRTSPRSAPKVPSALVADYLAEVDPTGVLDRAEQAKRVTAAYRRDLARRELDRRRAFLSQDHRSATGGDRSAAL
jgi:hypothetical protein